MSEAFIVSAVRTAGGRRNGRLSGWHPSELAGRVIDAIVERAGCDVTLVEDVIMGCAGQAGEQSMNVARMAVLNSCLPLVTPATTVDRQCGSSQQALHFAAQAVMSGTQDVVIAAGVESMSRVPMGTTTVLPEKNGLGTFMSPQIVERFACKEFTQFLGAELLAKKYGLSREMMDEYALQSHRRAAAATRAGHFKDEIVPVAIRSREHGELGEMHVVDEGVRMDASMEQIGSVKLLQEGGRVTAANASQICDGASGVLVVNERGLKALGVRPLARVHHMTVLADDPVVMLEAPIPATQRALKRSGLSIGDIDLFEVNEAFACVPMAWMQATGADPIRVNTRGGGISLGHPLGASGTKLAATLVHALGQTGGRYGLLTMCEGGGMANCTIIERL